MTHATNLYFIAIVLPDHVSTRVVSVQRYIAGKFQSHRSLRVVPHITLKAPFKLEHTRHSELLSWFSGLDISVQPYVQGLCDFGAFTNEKSPVIYIKPTAVAQLYTLQKQILTQFEQAFADQSPGFTERNFSPHITVAYRDLSPALFREAWEEFRLNEFRDHFEVQAFHLLQHSGKQWMEIATHTMG